MKTKLLGIIVISSIIVGSSGIVMWVEYGMICNNAVVKHLQKYSNLFEENTTQETYAIKDIGFPLGVHKWNVRECVNFVLDQRIMELDNEN